MSLYKRLATIERILESEKRVPAEDPVEAHDRATNLGTAARELVRAATRNEPYAAADCALHAKNLADNLSLYLQHHAAEAKVDLTRLWRNTKGLTTLAGVPVVDRFRQTHDHQGEIADLRHGFAHGDYRALPKDDVPLKQAVADEYLRMAEDCLLAIHEPPGKTTVFDAARAYGHLNGSRLAVAGTLLGVLGFATFVGTATQQVKQDARERALRNALFVAYSEYGTEIALRTQTERAPIVNMAHRDFVVWRPYYNEHELDFVCPRTQKDFAAWLDKVAYAEYATHECLGYWADGVGGKRSGS